MLVTRLEVRGFRNLEPLDLEPEPGPQIVLGDNGAGKTSLLEAIYLLATTRSFRTAQIADCCRHGRRDFHLRGEVEGVQRTRLDVSWEDGRRQRRVNGGRASLAEHLGVLPLIAWTAADLDILVGPPQARRRFLDRGVVGLHPPAIEVLGRYRQALSEKRGWLARSGRRGPTRPGDPAELETWNKVLAAAAADLLRRRAAYVERLATVLGDLVAELGIPPVEIRYRPSPRRGPEGVAAVLEELDRAAAREVKLEQPLLGPHRDELEIRWNGRDLRRVASAGERKLLGLAFVAAHGRILDQAGRPPVCLLDDADAELDRRRLESLWPLFGRARQLWVTSNRPAVWEALEGRRWRCEDGRISK